MRTSQFGFLAALVLIVGVVVTVGLIAVTGPESDLDGGGTSETEERRSRVPDAVQERPGVVTGEVRVFKTNAPAGGVAVRIEADGAGKSSDTNENGYFSLRCAPGPDRTVVVEAPEPYASITLHGVSVESGRSVSLGTLYLEKAFVVRGVVVDGSGKPVPGAAVRVHRPERERSGEKGLFGMIHGLGDVRTPLETAQTDASGTFVCRTLSPGEYVFEAEAGGYAVGFKLGVVVSPETSSRWVRIVLAPGESLVGTVKNGEGESLAGCRVTVVRVSQGMPTDLEFRPVQTVADASGHFSFTNLTRGRAGLMVNADGYPRHMVDRVDIGRQETVDIVLKGDSTVEGTVSDQDGNAVDGASVIVVGLQRSPAFAFASTGASGTFRIEHMSEGPIMIMVTKEGYAPWPTGAGLFSMGGPDAPKLVAGETLHRDVTLMRGAIVTGRVTDGGTGRPVAGAELRIVSPMAFGAGGSPPTDITGDEGTYRLTGIGPGKHILVASAPGYVQTGLGNSVQALFLPETGKSGESPFHLEVKDDTTEIRRNLVLPPAARITGRVVTPDGKPVPSARVALKGNDANLAVFERFMGVSTTSALTNAEGEFHLTSLAGDEPMQLEATSEGWVSGVSEPFTAASGTEVDDIVIRMGAPGSLEGVVVGADGAPLVNASVRAAPQGEGTDAWQSARALWEVEPIMTDDEGRFRFDNLPPGSCVVQVEAPDHVTGTQRDVVVTAGQATSGLIVKLSAGQVIEGVVRDDGGKPLPGVHLSVRASKDRGVTWDVSRTAPRTDEDGRFRADRLAPGEYLIRASLQGYVDVKLEKIRSGTKGLRITLTRGKTITGRALGPNGQPVAGVRISAHRAGSHGSGISDRDGRFVIQGLKDGEYRVNASPMGIEDLRGCVLEGVLAGSDGVILRLEVGFTISGIVVDESGQGLPSIFVFASGRTEKGKHRAAPSNTVRTGGDGRFTITGLDEGAYSITVNARDRHLAEPVISFGGSHGVRLVLEPGNDGPPPVLEAPLPAVPIEDDD